MIEQKINKNLMKTQILKSTNAPPETIWLYSWILDLFSLALSKLGGLKSTLLGSSLFQNGLNFSNLTC